MKLITLEEHFSAGVVPGIRLPRSKEAFLPGTCPGAPFNEDRSTLAEIGEKRLAFMDGNGISMQVLSTTSGQALEADTAVEYCRTINDYLAGKIAEHPERFAGFAAIPTAVPEACADELERCVKELGFVGCLIGGRVEGGFLNDEAYDPFLAKAEELEVPIYLHPGVPPQGVIDECYSRGVSKEVSTVMSMYGYGWHVDPGIHMLSMVMSGVFDRHPKLQMILGHWGELLPYFLDRFDTSMPGAFAGLEHDPSYYLRHNMYVTPSGIFTPELLEYCVKMLGTDRILFSVDYPWVTPEGMEKILNHPMLTPEDVEAIAHGNAERLLHLK